ncbi:MAG: adenylate/guanylate cyclase domain-containing protein [Actinomycetota bacterium]
MRDAEREEQLLRPYLPRLLINWLAESPQDLHRTVDGSVAFVDISGFTKLSERLARLGKVGSEELTDAIGTCFARLLGVAYGNGGGLIKFGGDALLLLFTGPDHPIRACRAAVGMRRALREIGAITSAAGRVTLRMSVGVHSGSFDFFLVGRSHRELIITGPAASETVSMESTAKAGEIVISHATAALIPAGLTGEPKGDGVLLRREPGGLSTLPVEHMVSVSAEQLVGCIPGPIREQVLAGIDEPEHKRATIAFLHFDGTDGLIDGRGRDAAAAALDELVVGVQDAADRHGVCFLGTDVDRDGGKIILTAGAPTASGNDEERMLLSLREIVGRPGALPVRVGVNRGEIFAGDIGPPYRRTYTVMGDAVNLAARLMAKAKPDEILTVPSVLERSRTRFETVALEPFLVKGKAKPVHAYAVGSAGKALGEAARSTAPLVGREREMEALREALASAREGSGRVVEIVGEPGIGKSRLIEELRNEATGMKVVPAACELYGSSTPYGALRAPLRALLVIGEHDDNGAAAARLTSLVASNAPELAPWLPLIAMPLDIDIPATQEVLDLDDEFRKARLEQATSALLGATVAGETLWILEDVHWMDEASAGLLTRITSGVAEHPWLICVTRRDVSEGFAARAGPHLVVVRPEPLDAAAAAALADAETEETPLPPHELASLAERSGGNPFFLKELIAAARAAGGIEGLPESVEALITARIDRLAPGDRSLLKRVSVLGPHFSRRIAEAVVPENVSLDDLSWRRLDEFIEADVSGFRFRHALIRDAAYEALPYRLRRRLHAAVGDALEAGAEDADHLADTLSLHFFHAGRYERAWRYSNIASERARSVFANVEAAEFQDRAIEAARRHGDIPPAEVASAYEILGDVRKRIGEFSKAAEAYRVAGRVTEHDALSRARLMLKQGRVRQAWGRFSEAVRWFGKANRLLEPLAGEEAASRRAQVAVAYASVRKDQRRSGEVVRWSIAAIGHAELGGDKAALANAYSLLEAALVNLGEWEKAVYADRALALYEELGDLWGQGVVFNNLGARAYYEGRWDEAVRFYERGRDAWERIGDTINAATGTANTGEILSDQGKLDEAEQHLRKAVRVWQAAGDRASVAFGLSALGRLLSRRGSFADALETLEEARSTAEVAGATADAIEAEVRRGEGLLLSGDPGRALEVLNAVDDRIAGEADAEQVAATVFRLRGTALAWLGDLPAAQEALAKSLDLAHARKAEFDVALALRARAQVFGDEGDLEASAEILDRLGVVFVRDPPIEGSEAATVP